MADKAKQLRTIEGHLNKSRDVEVKKVTLVKAAKAGQATNNVLEFLETAKSQGLLSEDVKDKQHQAMVLAAVKSRAQLKNVKMKTSPMIMEEEEEKPADEEGEDGDGEGGGGDE